MNTPNTVLNVNGIEVIYNHVILVLKGVSLNVAEGQISAILGGNGAGKTTLIRTLLGFNKVNDGAELEVLGHLPGLWPQALKNDIGYVPQRFAGFDGLTIDEAIATVKPFYQDWDDAFAEKLAAATEKKRLEACKKQGFEGKDCPKV